MGKKEFLKQMESLNRKISEHEAKIKIERNKSFPGAGRIKYWEREILAFKDALEKAKKRLRRGR
ncbi:MAG: hypothetical protein IBX72_06240 [Nitrospirae bacterium]|jgi:hypothetical protein|nr:hypothetical protein [Nitrospirota bacterium]